MMECSVKSGSERKPAPQEARDQNSDDCRSSFFGLFSRLAGAAASPSPAGGAAACDETGSINAGSSFAARLTAGETS
jgi:hypothetical protein